MKKIKLTLALVAVFFTCSAFAQTAQEVQAKFNEAAAAFNAKQFVQAVPLFEEVVSMGAMAEGDVSGILTQAKTFLYKSYMNAGKISAQARNFDVAIDMFRKANKITISLVEKNNADKMVTACYNAQIGAKRKAGDMAGAAAIANEGYQANKRDFRIGTLAAQSYADMGNTAKALEIYDEIIALGKTPRFVNAAADAKKRAGNTMLGAAIKSITAKDYTKALTEVETALKYSPKDSRAELARIQILNDSKNYTKLVQYGPEAIAAQKTALNKSNAAFMVAIAYQELKNNPKAIEYYKQVVDGASKETAAKLVVQLSKQAE